MMLETPTPLFANVVAESSQATSSYKAQSDNLGPPVRSTPNYEASSSLYLLFNPRQTTHGIENYGSDSPHTNMCDETERDTSPHVFNTARTVSESDRRSNQPSQDVEMDTVESEDSAGRSGEGQTLDRTQGRQSAAQLQDQAGRVHAGEKEVHGDASFVRKELGPAPRSDDDEAVGVEETGKMTAVEEESKEGPDPSLKTGEGGVSSDEEEDGAGETEKMAVDGEESEEGPDPSLKTGDDGASSDEEEEATGVGNGSNEEAR
jgi:hypothetical protein